MIVIKNVVNASRRFFAMVCAVSVLATLVAPLITTAQGGVQTSLAPLAVSFVRGQSETLLPDGRWLVLGGEGDALDTARLEDRRVQPVATQTLSPSAGHTARAWHTATVLPNGQVFVFGGLDASGAPVVSSELFDPSTLVFQGAKDVGLTPRSHHTATLMTDGHLLIAGGIDSAGHVVDNALLWNTRSNSVVLVAQMNSARADHSAKPLPTAPVLLEGGHANDGSSVASSEIYDPLAQRFNPVSSATGSDLGVTTDVAASIPEPNALDVPLDSVLAVRFTSELRIDSLNEKTVTLVGPVGSESIHVVGAEHGSLLFVTPTVELSPATHYTLFIAGASDVRGNALPFTAISFTTVAKNHGVGTSGNAPTLASAQAANPSDGVDVQLDTEVWIPDARHMHGDWKAHAEKSPFEDMPPLQAKPGVTAFAGQVLLFDGKPLRDVTLTLNGKTVQSDERGQFLIENVSTGVQTLTIDGHSADKPGKTYGVFMVRVDVPSAGVTNVMQYTIWMPRIDTKSAVKIPSPTTQEVVVTTPYIPGLELHIPPGMVIRDRDGSVVTEVSITPIPIDRAPYPLPTNDVPVYFTVQPGGATLHASSPTGAKGAQLIYPNYTGSPPKQLMNFWTYDPREKGWYVYGDGHVSDSGTQVVPDPGVQIYEFNGAMVGLPSGAPPVGPPPGGCTVDGDPVDCATGLFLHETTDLFLQDTMPLTLTRTYRPNDIVSRAFGIGMNYNYGVFVVGDTFPYTYVDVILPDGGRIHFDRISPGTSYIDAVYKHVSSPTPFYGSIFEWVDNSIGGVRYAWRLTLVDGSKIYFPEAAGLNALRSAAVAFEDRHGNVTVMTRDANTGLLLRVTSPNGRYIDFTYDTSYRVTQAKDSIGRVVTYTYDASGRLASAKNPSGGVESYTYDTSHRMLTVKKPNGKVMVTNQYDANGRVVKQTLADGGVYQFSYTLDSTTGRVKQTDVTNPRGIIRRTVFNSSGYVVSETRALNKPEQQVTTATVNANNLVESRTDALGRTTTYSYDELGRIATVTRLAGTANATTDTFTYDPASSAIATRTDALNRMIRFEYDAQGNLTGARDADNNLRFTVTHNSVGQPLSYTDAMNNTTRFEYDSGDLVATVDAAGVRSERFVDAAGRLVIATDGLGRRARYDRDALDHLVKLTDALNNVTQYAYDVDGNMTSLTDAKGGVTKFAYDAKDRQITYTDPLNKAETTAFDGLDNRTQITERNGKITKYTYDALNRVTQATYGSTKTGAPDATVTYSYDAGNRVTQVVDSQGGTISYTYDDFDRVLTETTSQGTVTYTYDIVGRLTSRSVPNQTKVDYTWNNIDQLVQITQGADVVSFTYDAAGRRSSMTLPNSIRADYTYDANSRLTRLAYSRFGAVVGDLVYEYNAIGERIRVGGSLARTLLPTAVTSATYNAANQLTKWGAATMTYDGNGNLSNDGINAYTWDSRNRMTKIGSNATFAYDVFGRRTSKTVGGVTTSFVYDGNTPVQERNGATIKANLLTGLGIDEYFKRTEGTISRNLITDALGSTLALIDDSGVGQTQYAYEPFGKATTSGASDNNAFQYTGREADGTGLYYYRARYYNPTTQRFVSQDPLRFGGGDVNLYVYVGNNPLSFIDPLGLYSWPEFVGDAANASAGFGDTISFGLTDWIRDQLGVNGSVNKCSAAYSGGEWAGIGYGFAAGGAAGWRAAGQKAAGKEFSHWIPNRMGGPRSNWNGNYVTPQRHYYHDPYRYPKGWRDFGPKWPGPIQQMDRVPNVYKGGAAGGGAAAASAAGNSCECQ